jgi:hypothetical protein
MTDEHQPGSVVNMAIIGDVDEEFVEYLVLNPAMEHWNDSRAIGIRIVQVKLYVYVLQFYCGFFFEYGAQVVAPSSRFISPSMWHDRESSRSACANSG